MKQLLLIRHLESTKNLRSQFSAPNSTETLTAQAKMEGQAWGENIAAFIQKKHLQPRNIYCAESNRAIETAEFLSRACHLPIISKADLRSSSLGIMSGKSEAEVREVYPLFIKQLELYRVGLYNSYEFEEIEGRESKASLESRIMQCIDEILAGPEEEDTKIIILHRSSLNCTLIHMARRLYHFTDSFWPSPATDYGGIYWIALKDKNDEFSFKALNVSSSQLLELT